jgi:DegV family protein with EDD domain
MIHIVTDSTADLPPELVTELGIQVVPCFILFGTESFLDGVTITRKQFYTRLMSDAQLPTTAAAGVGMFTEVFQQAQPGDEIISIHVAAKLSGLWNAARLASETVPGVRVVAYDSGSISMGMGWQVIFAARAARQGKSLEQILALLDDLKPRSYTFAALDTMEFLRRSGRVSWARALVGQMLNIKPLVKVYQSQVESAGRVRSRSRAVAQLIQLVTMLGPLEALAVLHTMALAEAKDLAKSVAGLVPGQAIPIVDVTPTIGVHVGPNGLGLAAVACA